MDRTKFPVYESFKKKNLKRKKTLEPQISIFCDNLLKHQQNSRNNDMKGKACFFFVAIQQKNKDY